MSLVLTGTSGASNLDSTNGLQFATWTTATRPASPIAGQMGYNTTTNAFDAYVNGAWVSIATSSTAPTSGPTFSAYQATSQTGVAANTWTRVNLDTEVFDTNNNFASNRFTPTVAGYYQINGTVTLVGGNSAYYVQAGIYKNGSSVSSGSPVVGNGAFYPQSTCGTVVFLNGSTDYVELYTFGSAGGSFSVYNALTNTNFSGSLVRTA